MTTALSLNLNAHPGRRSFFESELFHSGRLGEVWSVSLARKLTCISGLAIFIMYSSIIIPTPANANNIYYIGKENDDMVIDFGGDDKFLIPKKIFVRAFGDFGPFEIVFYFHEFQSGQYCDDNNIVECKQIIVEFGRRHDLIELYVTLVCSRENQPFELYGYVWSEGEIERKEINFSDIRGDYGVCRNRYLSMDPINLLFMCPEKRSYCENCKCRVIFYWNQNYFFQFSLQHKQLDDISYVLDELNSRFQAWQLAK